VITLVTGAAGVSGRALLHALSQDASLEIHTTDLLSLSRENHHPCDLTDPVAVTDLIKTLQPERVFHLAGTFTNRFATDHPCNVLASRHILEAVQNAVPGSRVLLVGSAAEYGKVDAGENPVAEDHSLRPFSVYGLTKVMQTLLMEYFHRTRRSDVVMARTFNLDGPGVSASLLPGRLEAQIAAVKRGEVDHIALGSLEGRRDFIPLEDAAGAYVRIMQKGVAGEVYNVGSGVPVSLRTYVEKRVRDAGLDPRVVREGAADGKAMDIWADIEKLKKL
jgi:GDP-4-dehydro-6-deoxy-D-mannose reductase